MIMKRRIIDILSAFFQAIDTLLCKCQIKSPKVIVYLDGGICSQMLMYLHDQYYAEQGFDVRYDTRWYETCGKDQFGNMPRYFEFKEMWPKLEMTTISNWQRKWYLLFFKAKRTKENWLPEPTSVKHSMYLYEYWNIPADDHRRLFAKCYNLSESSAPAIGKLMDFEGVVGVHVRRGDLAKGDNPYYGGVSEGYFLRAIELCNKEFKPKKYLFFSDEPDWVEQNICNHITQPYEIMRGNKAWEDLWLLAHCPIIVASQGSFGKVAARLNQESVLIQCDNEHANHARKNTYLIK